MKKKLEQVNLLIVHATQTSLKWDLEFSDILRQRLAEGLPDIGFHYIVKRSGMLIEGIPTDEVGTHTPRFSDNSIGILMVGGKTTRGKPSDNYTQEQKETLHGLLDELTTTFTNSKIVGSGELLGGTSPHMNLEEMK